MKRAAGIVGLLACIGALLWVGLVGARFLQQMAMLRHEAGRLRSEIARNPGDAGPHAYLAAVLSGLGNDREALTELHTAIKLSPDEPQYHSDLGQVLWRLGNKTDARREVVLAAELGEQQGQDKGRAVLFSANAGKVLEDAGRYEEAERHYEMALAQKAIVDANLGADPMADEERPLFAKLRKSVESRLSAVKVRVTPGRPSTDWIVRHISYLKTDQSKHSDTEKAVIEALSRTQTSPNGSTGWFNLGWAYMWQGRFDAASDALDRAHSLGDEGAEITARDVRSASRAFKKESGKK